MPADRGDRDPLLAALPALLRDLAAASVVELDLTVGDARLYIRQRPGQQATPVTQVTGTPPVDESAATEEGLVAITTPLAGVFYATPSPDQPAYVRVGDEVEVGQVVALVEAMKAFNEIRSELAGTVEKILVAPGQVLRAGQALIQLRPRPVGGEGG